ncbi:MAG TPA: hypothetical protein VNQ14_06900 [Woeseiaceae bacterium]|nr:hypothetical protein [Woeseiaceae bacterium]
MGNFLAKRSVFFTWCLRGVLAGFMLSALSFALVAWFDNPPIAARIFDVGWVVTGVFVVAGIGKVLVDALHRR